MSRRQFCIGGILLLYLSAFLCPVVSGNNVRLSGTPKAKLNATRNGVELDFTLSWDNSWRDPYNWDAVWVFVKWKQAGTTVAWNALSLSTGTVVPSGLSCDSEAGGVMLYRSTAGVGNIAGQPVTLKIPLSGFTVDQIEKNKISFAVTAIEMVLVPYGAFYLGDGAAAGSFCDAKGRPVSVGGEEQLSVSTLTVPTEPSAPSVPSAPVTVPAAFPKGYKCFYLMKYELSQEQYVNYLNMLSLADQKLRIGNGLDGLKQGAYVFGDKGRVNCRNGIAVFANSGGTAPAIFACNLNQSNDFSASDDGQTLACNYLTSADLEAYCTWSGLRAVSELEYEKACRSSNQAPVAGEYAWNSTALIALAGADGLKSGSAGSEREVPASLDVNVNAGNTFGPVRCGSLGSTTTNQQQAGAGFWGGMELSGNVAELCQQFNGGYCLRGGSFASVPTRLQTSDRSLLSVAATRDSTAGFRAARSLAVQNPAGGTLTVKDGKTTACPGMPLTINGTPVASTTLPVTYLWYVRSGGGAQELIPDQTGADLTYDRFTNTTTSAITYYFKRKALTALGEAWSTNEVYVSVSNPTIKLTPDTVKMDLCGYALPVKAAPVMGSVTLPYTWSYKDLPIGDVSDAIYTPAFDHFKGNTGDLTVLCTAIVNGCISRAELVVSVPVLPTPVAPKEVTAENCGSVMFYDDRDGDRKAYCTVKIGTQCWMGTNLNVGKFTEIITGGGATGDGTWVFNKAGIQKWCIGAGSNVSTSKAANCAKYGGLYEWWEMVCGGQCNDKVDATNAQTLSLSSESQLSTYGAKMTTDGTKVQGICPDGWHIPTDAEWTTLEKNKEGWGAKLGGQRYNNGYGFYYLGSYGYWWSSTPYSNYGAYYRYLSSMADGTALNQSNDYRSNGFSVRCLRN